VDLVLKGRGEPISERVRRIAEHRVAKLDGPRRPSVTRLEVEIIEEGSARVGGGHRVELTCVTTRPTFFAEASGQTIDEALDHALTRLARQIDRYRGKREARLTRASRRSEVEPTFDGEPAPVAEVETSP
jgi:ribosomal subunit interface protein